MNYSSRINTIEKGEIICGSLLFLLLPPIITLPILCFYVLQQKYARKTNYILFFICIALYFASINATKRPAGDQIQYYYAYKNVPTKG